MVQAIIWKGDHLELIDQRVLPFKRETFVCKTAADTSHAIERMVVRGAPAIGVTAAYGLVLALQNDPSGAGFEAACKQLAASRPTAVNLFDAIEYMKTNLGDLSTHSNPAAIAEKLAVQYHEDDTRMNQTMGKHGAGFLKGEKLNILTHCNAGALATSGWGTALGIIRELHKEGRINMVYADETRPFLQGARLTVWELQQDNIPVTLITDGMSGHMMSKGMIDAVIVGSDRIATNGDIANKIGTFMVALAAQYHKLPFVVAAPTTTIDRKAKSGADIPIEEREHSEVTHVRGQIITDEGVGVFNPAFDVSPAELVTAIITEEGVFQAPYDFRP